MTSGDEMASRKVLLSGGSGFVGAAIARAFAEKHPQWSLTIVDLNPPGPVNIVPESASFVRVDVTNKDEVSEAFQRIRPDIVIHTAGIVPRLSERFGRRLESMTRKINVEGTRNMLDAAKAIGARGFVYTSSCCVVTDYLDMPFPNIDERWPTSPSSLIYGESKVLIPEYSAVATL